MSELKRWDANRVSKEPAMLCHEYGPYVLIEDYVKLKTENERLRKAGDAMADQLEFFQQRWNHDEPTDEARNWDAVKEGRDAK